MRGAELSKQIYPPAPDRLPIARREPRLRTAYSSYPPEWDTPLVKLERESEQHGCTVYAKLELVNPTGVHKDRESSAVIADMKKKGFRALACASSGNAAISVSAFAYMNGFESHVFVGSEIPQEKLTLVKMFHPVLHTVEGDYLDAVEALKKFIAGRKVYNANAGFCEAKLVGNSYIGMEVAREAKPSYVICPTNNGTHFVGVGLGVKKVGVRVCMVAAIAPDTEIAHSIKGYYHLEEPKISAMIDQTCGSFVKLTDDELKRATVSLAQQGIVAEPASAASVAALSHLRLQEQDVVCCTITGSGLKYPALTASMLKKWTAFSSREVLPKNNS